MSKRVFLESPFLLCSGVLRENLKGAEKKLTLQKHPFGQPFLRTTPSPLLWRALNLTAIQRFPGSFPNFPGSSQTSPEVPRLPRRSAPLSRKPDTLQMPICGFLRIRAVFCGFLRKSAVSCEDPRFPNSLFSRRRREFAKNSENLRKSASGLGSSPSLIFFSLVF